MDIAQLIFIFTISAFLGLELIAKIPAQLQTPLMSGSNAISGITIVGSMLALTSIDGQYVRIIGFVAVVLATINVVGGYVVTDRMLAMFKKKETK